MKKLKCILDALIKEASSMSESGRLTVDTKRYWDTRLSVLKEVRSYIK